VPGPAALRRRASAAGVDAAAQAGPVPAQPRRCGETHPRRRDGELRCAVYRRTPHAHRRHSRRLRGWYRSPHGGARRSSAAAARLLSAPSPWTC
jgi:hypothetical protein